MPKPPGLKSRPNADERRSRVRPRRHPHWPLPLRDLALSMIRVLCGSSKERDPRLTTVGRAGIPTDEHRRPMGDWPILCAVRAPPLFEEYQLVNSRPREDLDVQTHLDGRDPITIRAANQVKAILRLCAADEAIATRWANYM
jgi:hypothetical protein